MISYKIKAKLAKNVGTDDFSLEEFEKTFINEKNPINSTPVQTCIPICT